MLRSFAYVASGVADAATATPRPGRLGGAAARALLEGYRAAVDPALLPPPDIARTLSRVFELEKAVYELRYELDNRPDWVSIPVGTGSPPAGDHRSMSVDGGHPAPSPRGDLRGRSTPTRLLGAHPDNGGVGSARLDRCRDERARPPEGWRARRARAARRRRPVRGPSARGAKLPLAYELEVAYPDGNTFTMHDPYSFPPTLGELDLHLAGEGRHEELYERLGAHVREIDGATGVAFAVWAPNARSVSVVGDFNGWDGAAAPDALAGGSRASGSSSCRTSARRRALQVRDPHAKDGELRLKADPFAFAAEHAAATASIVSLEPRVAGRRVDGSAPGAEPLAEPVSIYEVHLGSWRRTRLDGGRP